MSSTTFLFVPNGGEGVALGAASAMELHALGRQVKVTPVSKKPGSFKRFISSELQNIRIPRGTEVIFQNVVEPLDEVATAELVGVIREFVRRGVRVRMIDDHHRAVLFPWKEMAEAGAEVWVSASASWAFYYPQGRSPRKASRHAAKYGGIIHRDPSVLPFISEQDEEIAAGLVLAAAKDFSLALTKMLAKDEKFFLAFAARGRDENLSLELKGKVIRVNDLSWATGAKRLHLAIKRLGADVHYGVGITKPRKGKRLVIAARNWRIASLPPTTFILGHGSTDIASAVNLGAVVFEVPSGKAQSTADRIVKALSRFTPSAHRTGAIENPFELTVKYMSDMNFPKSMTVHGPDHISRVFAYGNTLQGMLGIPDRGIAQAFGLACAWHDLGLWNDGVTSPEQTRREHHRRSAQIIEREFRSGHLRLLLTTREQVERVKALCIAHRKCEQLPLDPALARAAAILRLADALDVTAVRAHANDWGQSYEALRGSELWPDGDEGDVEVAHWEGHRAVRNVRLMLDRGGLRIESLVNRSEFKEFSIGHVREDGADLESVLAAENAEFQMDWSIVEVA